MESGKEKASRVHLRGFGSMDKERQREIASQGGKTAQRLGVGHKFTSEEARAAGRIGGKAKRRSSDV